jgi:hypothetical protein
MQGGGLDLALPPVNIWRGVARTVLATRMLNGHAYSLAAGGFAKVPSMPALQRLTPKGMPVNTQSDANIRLVELYGQQPNLFKQRIASQFSPGVRR